MPTTESGSYANGLGSASKSSAGVSSNSKKALIESFERFVSENQEWLKPYAVFCALAEIFQTTEHWLWGHLAKCDDKLIEKLTKLAHLLTKIVQFWSEESLNGGVIRFLIYRPYKPF